MIVPNKVISFNESIIGKMIFVLSQINEGTIDICSLYNNTLNYFEDINEFIYALDVLFLLELIYYDKNKGEYFYVKRNKM